MGADVIEGSNLGVVASDDEDVLAARMAERSVVVGSRHLALVAREDPGPPEYFFLLFSKESLVRVETAVDVVRTRELRAFCPFCGASRHLRISKSRYSS
jgi:hypothetical protein